MTLRQFLIRKLMLFFTLSTLITIAIYILGTSFDPAARFGYDGFLSPLIYAGVCVVPSLVTWSKRELKLRELLLRELLQFLLTETIVLGLAFRSSVIDTSRPAVVIGIAGSVLVIYLLAFLISWATNSAEARETDRELQKFQRLHGVDLCVSNETAQEN
ncbi:MAG: hypothetical protein IJI61_06920 [Oscillospiraceae bacterium]|nr:hypothetical protein [Oscillospiraceae bacterium]